MSDNVNHPPHYNSHPSGVECIQVTEHMNFCIGNAVKYLWRAGLKGDALEDLKKAKFYVEREIAKEESRCSRPTIICGGCGRQVRCFGEHLADDQLYGPVYECPPFVTSTATPPPPMDQP